MLDDIDVTVCNVQLNGVAVTLDGIPIGAVWVLGPAGVDPVL